MEHSVLRGRGIAAPHLPFLRRRRRADVVSIAADAVDDAVEPSDQRYYELGCLPPRLRDQRTG